MKMFTGQAWSRVLLAGGWVSHTWTTEGVRQEGFPRNRKGKACGGTEPSRAGLGSGVLICAAPRPILQAGHRLREGEQPVHCGTGALQTARSLSRRQACGQSRCSVV